MGYLKKVIEKYPDETPPVDMEECVNDEYDDKKEKTTENINEG